MDKIFSTRVDSTVLKLLDELSKRLKKSKKRIIEEAVEQYARDRKDEGFDILEETSGCWERDEEPEETAEKVRKTFSDAFKRHHE
jgi:predicted transcriptional regulator